MSRRIYFLPPWTVSWVCERMFSQEKQDQYQTLYTITVSGTCIKKKGRGANHYDTIDSDL
jgi:hypothetical protein